MWNPLTDDWRTIPPGWEPREAYEFSTPNWRELKDEYYRRHPELTRQPTPPLREPTPTREPSPLREPSTESPTPAPQDPPKDLFEEPFNKRPSSQQSSISGTFRYSLAEETPTRTTTNPNPPPIKPKPSLTYTRPHIEPLSRNTMAGTQTITVTDASFFRPPPGEESISAWHGFGQGGRMWGPPRNRGRDDRPPGGNPPGGPGGPGPGGPGGPGGPDGGGDDGPEPNNVNQAFIPMKIKPFTGTQKDVDRFLMQCNVFLRLNAQQYDTDHRCIAFILSHCSEPGSIPFATQYIASGRLETDTFEEFIQEFERTFVSSELTVQAQLDLDKLRQTGSIEAYNLAFKPLIQRARIDGYIAQRNQYWKGLNNNLLQKLLACHPQPTTMDGWYYLATKLDTGYKIGRAMDRRPYQAGPNEYQSTR